MLSSCCSHKRDGSFHKGEMRYVYVTGRPPPNLSMLTIWLEPPCPLCYSSILISATNEPKSKTAVAVNSHTTESDISTFCCYMVCFRRSLEKGSTVFLSMFLPVRRCWECTKIGNRNRCYSSYLFCIVISVSVYIFQRIQVAENY